MKRVSHPSGTSSRKSTGLGTPGLGNLKLSTGLHPKTLNPRGTKMHGLGKGVRTKRYATKHP